MQFTLRKCQLRWLVVNLFWVTACVLCARPSPAQQIAPECSAADLDTSYRFLNSPPNEKVVVNFRNISQRACTLWPGGGVTFNDYRHGHSIWTTDCRNCDADGKPQTILPLPIAAGQTAYLIVSWETARGGDMTCQEGGTLNSYVNGDLKHGYFIWAGSLLGDVCSVVRVDSYRSGTFADGDAELRNAGSLKQPSVSIKLSPSGDVFYGDDSFWLYADISDPQQVLQLDEHSCPNMFLRTRGFDGATSLEQIGGQCQLAKNGSNPGRSIRLKIWTLGRGALAGVDTRVEVLAFLSAPHAPEVEMVSSNPIVLHRVDSSTLVRKWGPQAKGIAVSLQLDKPEYLAGEDIPLRLAAQNFSATGGIWSGELPCGAGLTFEVRDSNGRTVESVGASICTGHGLTQGYPQGKVVPIRGLTLSGERLLPDRPGDYIVTVTWRPFAGDAPPMGVLPQSTSSAPLIPYAAAQSASVALRVVP